MPYFVAFGPDPAPARAGLGGVGQTPYERLVDAIEAAVSGKKAAADHGVNQRYSVVEAPTSRDAMLFAAAVQPPRHVLESLFGDPDHVITGHVVWTEGGADWQRRRR